MELDYNWTFPPPKYDQYGLPDYIISSLKRYYEQGQLPEALVYAVLSNDLFTTVAYCDQESFDVIKQTCLFVVNEFMPGTFGSQDILKRHMIMMQRKLRTDI